MEDLENTINETHDIILGLPRKHLKVIHLFEIQLNVVRECIKKGQIINANFYLSDIREHIKSKFPEAL